MGNGLCCFVEKHEEDADAGVGAASVQTSNRERNVSEVKLTSLKEDSHRHLQEKNYYDAISVLDDRLKLERELCGKSTQQEDVAVTLGLLGDAYYHVENYGKSQLYLFESLETWKKLHPEYTEFLDERLAATLTNLGNVCEKNKDFQKAVKFHEEALKMKKAIEAGVATNDGRAGFVPRPAQGGSRS